MSRKHAHENMLRVLARYRGAPIPSPENIGPDSWFFDPLTNKPYEISIDRDKRTPLPRLTISRQVTDEFGRVFPDTMLTIYLPQ